jgi:hypothetical protein
MKATRICKAYLSPRTRFHSVVDCWLVGYHCFRREQILASITKDPYNSMYNSFRRKKSDAHNTDVD